VDAAGKCKMKRPTITFLVDVPNWSFDFVAKSIAYRLSYKYKFVTQYVSRMPILDPQSTDLLYVFFWGENWHKRFNFAPGKIIKEVASFRWRDKGRFGPLTAKEFARTYLTDCGLVTTPASCLYDELAPHIADLYLCPNGVEERLFMSRRAQPPSGPLKIGWVGNPLDEGKGLYDILIPATAGYEFFYTKGDLTREQLIRFYRNIDVLAIASKAESQPLPLLEGLASGCLPVTTSVGIVPELITNRARATLNKSERID
jgi:glycosyltransferase involved in cell wall biosynthesis